MLNHLGMEQGPSLGASFLTELELYDGASLLHPASRLPLKEMVLGAGGSALFHMLVVMGALLIALILPRPKFQQTFVNVSLVEMGGSKGGSCGTGIAGGALRSRNGLPVPRVALCLQFLNGCLQGLEFGSADRDRVISGRRSRRRFRRSGTPGRHQTQ